MAWAAFERVLRITEAILRGEHPDTATTLWWLGTLERDTHNTQKAREYLEEALTTYEEFLSLDYRDIKTVRGDLEAP